MASGSLYITDTGYVLKLSLSGRYQVINARFSLILSRVEG